MPSRRRPGLVTALSLVALLVAALALARLALALALPPLPFPIPAAYLALSGAAWGGVALVAGLGLLRGARWAPAFTRAASLALTLWYWADRLLLTRSDYSRRSWPAGVVVSLLAVTAAMWVLGRPAARAFFGETSA